MKKILLLFFLAAATLSVPAQFKADKEPFITKSLSSDAIQQVKVETSGGYITVIGGPAAENRIEVFVTRNNNKSASKEEIQQRLDKLYTLDIATDNHKLTVTAKPKSKMKDWKKSLSISFRIVVPGSASTDLTTSGGSISISKLSGGKQEFTTSGGSLHVTDVSGHVRGITSGGSIYVENSSQDIRLTTSGGSIEAIGCDGQLDLTTSGGSLRLKKLSGTIEATTSGGSIEGNDISGELKAFTSGGSISLRDLSCSLATSTSGGNITVSILQLGKYVDVSNSAGNIDLRLPANKGLDLTLTGQKIKTDQLQNFTGKVDDNRITGKLNGGGVPVTVRTSSGQVYLGLK